MTRFKLFDLACDKCDKRWEALIEDSEPFPPCPTCGSENAERVPNFGGYAIRGNNGASVRPSGSGCFKGRKN